MDNTVALESIIKLLPVLPPESIEDMLVTVDALAGTGDEANRPAAAKSLREAAARCDEKERTIRLLKAADSLLAGQACALTPDGLSWKQAAAAQTITLEEWEKQQADMPAPVETDDLDQDEDDEDEDEEDESEDTVMETAPPELPHLPVHHFFPGLAVRVGRDFQDAFGRAVCGGSVLHLLSCYPSNEGDGFTLAFLDRTVQLRATVRDQREIIRNGSNAWFQPIPSVACLEELWEAIDTALSDANENEDEDNEEELDDIKSDLDDCANWLASSNNSWTNPGRAPQCSSAPTVAKAFGRDSHLAVWIGLLFAGIAVCNRRQP